MSKSVCRNDWTRMKKLFNKSIFNKYAETDFRFIGVCIFNLAEYCNEAAISGDYKTNNRLITENFRNYTNYFSSNRIQDAIAARDPDEHISLLKELNKFTVNNILFKKPETYGDDDVSIKLLI